MSARRMTALAGLLALALAGLLAAAYAMLGGRSAPLRVVGSLAGTRNGEAAAADSGDPGSLAGALVGACADSAGPGRMSCYEQRLVALVSARGVAAAMAALERLGVRDRDVQRDGHVYAHAIGIAAYRHDPQVSRTFRECSEIYQSGCYHGVIQAYFDDMTTGGRALTAEAVNRLCSAYRDSGERWLLFQCVHGMGHGFTMFRGHDLPHALGDCDLLRDDWDRHSCYGGAFMENIVNATQPHHGGSMLHGAAHGTGGPGHASGPGITESGYRPVDPADPLYPCSALGERYLVDCYQMQTSAILYFNHGDIAAAARACDGAPETMRSWCYQSLGRDISSYTLQDPTESIRMCSLGRPRWQPWCYVGLVKNFVDLTARTDDGFAFCRQVPGEPNRLKCYEALGEEITVLETDPGRRTETCARSERGYVDACRYGARLTDRPPPGLPLAAVQ